MAVKPPVAALDPAPPAQPASAPQPARKRIVVPYRPLEGNASRILIAVNVNGRTEATMALDTGAPNTVISYALAERIGALREGERRLVTLTGGIGGFSLSELVILDSISIGEARSQFVPATIADLPSDAFEGLVGMDFVAGFQVEIDTANHRLVLAEQPPSPSAPAGHDESWWRRTSELFVGQRKQWESIQTAVHQRARESLAGDDELRQLIAFSETQAKEAQALAGKFERYASNNAVPREWRKQ